MTTASTDTSRAPEAPIQHTAYPFGGFIANSLLSVRLPGQSSQERGGTA